jgi:hypothetical protein
VIGRKVGEIVAGSHAGVHTMVPIKIQAAPVIGAA